LLIRSVILPLTEVANKAYPADIPYPSGSGVHHGVIEPNGKEDGRFRWLAFPLEGQFHFPLDPITLHSMFGEDQQQFVLFLDRLVDPTRCATSC